MSTEKRLEQWGPYKVSVSKKSNRLVHFYQKPKPGTHENREKMRKLAELDYLYAPPAAALSAAKHDKKPQQIFWWAEPELYAALRVISNQEQVSVAEFVEHIVLTHPKFKASFQRINRMWGQGVQPKPVEPLDMDDVDKLKAQLKAEIMAELGLEN